MAISSRIFDSWHVMSKLTNQQFQIHMRRNKQIHRRVIYHTEHNTINTRGRPESDIRRESLPKYYEELNRSCLN